MYNQSLHSPRDSQIRIVGWSYGPHVTTVAHQQAQSYYLFQGQKLYVRILLHQVFQYDYSDTINITDFWQRESFRSVMIDSFRLSPCKRPSTPWIAKFMNGKRKACDRYVVTPCLCASSVKSCQHSTCVPSKSSTSSLARCFRAAHSKSV
jgi:hypothetical protein